ncbi:Pyruvate dehydrogenase E1 component subunit alpha-3 [Hibiscus syriacus]|uniref:Pyruvate dehydrogenase E1 component subunit alpha-3 n=1 Tax=Hibiscus syriacus TaxID=106335 RepID=A0A6A3A116_HIBSY|nr:Pyruvate dehydrogenase E1 component subunit alpha-3 [Hibiscus syriacus]
MVLGRAFEDMCAQMYYRGKMFAFVHLYNGQEAVSRGVPLRAVMSELFGKTTGYCRDQGIPIATRATFTSKYKREVLKEVDCDHKLFIVFVVENNLWAIGMSHLRATYDPHIYKKGPAFGMSGIHVDGMDVLKVREVAKEAIGRARRGEGPTLVECETYRFRGHLLADPDELRDLITIRLFYSFVPLLHCNFEW